MRADDIAASVGGEAFAAQPFDHVSGETFVLQGMGDPELECEDYVADTCMRSPNFQRLSAGRMRTKLSHTMDDLLQFYSFADGHWFLFSPDLPACSPPCDLATIFDSDCSRSPVLSNFSQLFLHKRGAFRNVSVDLDYATAAALAESAWDSLNLAGAHGLRDRPCYPYIIATAAYVHTFLWIRRNLLVEDVVAEVEGASRQCPEPFRQELHNNLALLSLAWNIFNTAQLPSPLGVDVSHVVRCHERLINAYVPCVSRTRTQELESLIPIRYRLRAPLPVGQYGGEAAMLEHLEPDGQTLLAPQLGRHNPAAYRILPFLKSVRQDLCASGSSRHGAPCRRILIDVGAAHFVRGAKVLLDLYEQAAPFTHALLIDPVLEQDEVPELYRRKYNMTLMKRYISVGSRKEESDVLSILASPALALSEDDFVVLKFDVDEGGAEETSSIEWGFLADLLYSPRHLRLVDELFIEMHFFYPQCWGSSFREHTMWQHYDVLRQLRAQGIAVHAWP